MTKELLKSDRLPVRLLAEFYLEETNPQKQILPEHLGILYDSLLSSESNRSHIRLSVDGPDPLDPDEELDPLSVEGEFEIWPNQTESVSSEVVMPLKTIRFSLEINEDSKISFSRYLRNALIVVPCVVELGNNPPDFQLGPAVSITAKTIKLMSDSLIVGGKSILRPEEDDSVVLEALNCEHQMLKNQPVVFDREKFLVSWPGAESFPWTDFKAERIQEVLGDNDPALHKAYIRFKRIAQTFRSHGRGSLARTQVKIEHRRVLRGALGESLLKRLTDDGILVLKNGFYHWIPEKADSLMGVAWENLRKGDCPDSFRRYLSNFVDKNRHLF